MTFLKMSVCGDSRCTNTSLNSIFMNLSQVLHSTFLDNCFKQQTSLSPFQELIKILPMYLKDSQYILVQRSANSLFSYDLTTFVEGLDDRLLDNFPITVFWTKPRHMLYLYCLRRNSLKFKMSSSNLLRFWDSTPPPDSITWESDHVLRQTLLFNLLALLHLSLIPVYVGGSFIFFSSHDSQFQFGCKVLRLE